MISRFSFPGTVRAHVVALFNADSHRVCRSPLARVLQPLRDPLRAVLSVGRPTIAAIAFNADAVASSGKESCVVGRVLVPRRAMRPRGVIPQLRACLRDHIRKVIGVRAEEQMRRIHTRRIVARMTGEQPIGDWAEMQFPRNTVRLARTAIHAEMPVAPFVVTARSPYPTSRSQRWMNRAILVDLLPKPFSKALSHSVKLTLSPMRGNGSMLVRAA